MGEIERDAQPTRNFRMELCARKGLTSRDTVLRHSEIPIDGNVKQNRVALTALLLLIFAAYANSLNGPFVYDDGPAITSNATIRHLSDWKAILFPQQNGGLTVSGRPLLNLSLALNYAISGERVWSYHLLNLLIHSAAALALYGVVRRTVQLAKTAEKFRKLAVPVAWSIAALWALHPLQTQAVTYTIQRAESMMGALYFFTFYAFVRGARPEASRRWLWLSVAACAVGMTAKEVMVTAPVMVWLFDGTFIAHSFRAAWRERGKYYFALASTWILLAVLVASTGGNRGGTVGVGTGVPWWAYGLTQFQAVERYLALWLWPSPLIFEYGTFWVQRSSDFVRPALTVIPLLVATLVAVVRWPIIGFFGAWFFGILAPSSLAPGTIQMIVEHRPYLPIAALTVGLVLALFRLLGSRATRVCVLLAVTTASLTAVRNHDYRSNLALWSDTLAKRPNNPRAYAGMADAYAALGQREQAISARREAARLSPDDATYQYNLAVALAAAGRKPEALRSYLLAAKLDPTNPSIRNNLAVALGEAGNLGGAVEQYIAAEKIRANDPQLHFNHGLALFQLGQFDASIEQYRQALILKPDWAFAELNLGSAYVGAGRIGEAIPHFENAARLDPTNDEMKLTLGNAWLSSGQQEKAKRTFDAVLTRSPKNPKALFGLGSIAANAGDLELAVEKYQEALRELPDYADAHYKLGNVLLALNRRQEAIEHYRKATELSPSDAEAHNNLGIALAQTERLEAARLEFETAVKLRPNYRDAQQNLERVRGLLGR